MIYRPKLLLIGQSIPFTISVFEKVAREFEIGGIIEFTSKDRGVTANALSEFAGKIKAEYFPFFKNNTQDGLDPFYRKVEPDIVFICSMPTLLKENLISLPKMGTINVHPSFLPDYKGPNPKFWIYYNAEKFGGVSIHYVDKGEDTGNIILQKRFDIPSGLSSLSYDRLMIDTACDIASEAIRKVINGDKGVIQNASAKIFRARRIKRAEKLDECLSWDIERVFHFMNGTEIIPSCMTLPFLARKFFNTRIKNYKRENKTSNRVGKFSYSAKGLYYRHKDGKIYFSMRLKGL